MNGHWCLITEAYYTGVFSIAAVKTPVVLTKVRIHVTVVPFIQACTGSFHFLLMLNVTILFVFSIC